MSNPNPFCSSVSPPKRVLIASPIHQKPEILELFLKSLSRLQHKGLICSYAFIDDNQDPRSKALLQQFQATTPDAMIEESGKSDNYVRNEKTHYWSESLIWKVAGFKNKLIQEALRLQVDYLFLVDSDLLLHPGTLEKLIEARRSIISEIFWTAWQPDAMQQPQVWVSNEYIQWEQARGEQLSDEETQHRFHQFLDKMRAPGVYEVGGLGACTLIAREALLSGVHFSAIKNVSFWGEDRHFCIRAAALGWPLYVDTHYPAFHIYRDTDLDAGRAFLEHQESPIEPAEESGHQSIHESPEPPSCKAESEPPPIQAPYVLRHPQKLTLSMVVRNEGDRYLREVLADHRQYIDAAVIIDDASTDDTAAICLEELKGIPVRLIQNRTSQFHHEVELRKLQWKETIASDPGWVLNLDADERFEHRFSKEVRALLNQSNIDLYCFRLYDFWTSTQYRDDAYWKAHHLYRPFLMRHVHGFQAKWRESAQHCGRFPENIFELSHKLSPIRLKHFGWMNPAHRLEKYKRYLKLDPTGSYGWPDQYRSIMDEEPRLIDWVE